MTIALSENEWRVRLQRFLLEGSWNRKELGASPDEVGCRCPVPILREYCFDHAQARSGDGHRRGDANDIARNHGKDALRHVLDSAKPTCNGRDNGTPDGNGAVPSSPSQQVITTAKAPKAARPSKPPSEPAVARARTAIVKLGIDCRHDRFHDKLIVGGHAVDRHAGELTDHACLVLRRVMDEQFKFDPGRSRTLDACIQLCLEHSFDPVVDYLSSLKWDGTERLDTWLHAYLGAEDTGLNRAIARLALLAMVRRARQPGCKFDQIIVLEGQEGTLKSTALATLAGAPENFSDQTILGLKDQEQQERLRGKWVYEIADLSGIRKAEVEQVKAFASRTHDRARPAYGRSLVELPRRCVIFATTNDETYLKSRTGNRRFWPVRTGTIDIDALRRDRDHLLAEAAALEAGGCSLTLPEALWPDARAAQDERLEHDPWLDRLADLEGVIFPRPDGQGEEERITSDEILSTNLAISAERQTDAHEKRLAPVMRKLGWEGPKKMRVGDKSKRGYCRPVQP